MKGMALLRSFAPEVNPVALLADQPLLTVLINYHIVPVVARSTDLASAWGTHVHEWGTPMCVWGGGVFGNDEHCWGSALLWCWPTVTLAPSCHVIWQMHEPCCLAPHSV